MAANAQQLSLLTSKLASVLPPGQKFVSPCSIHLAMALVAAGATGQTLAELQAVLDECTQPDPDGFVFSQDLMQLFRERTGRSLTAKALKVRMDRKRKPPVKCPAGVNKGRRGYGGLRLLTSVSE